MTEDTFGESGDERRIFWSCNEQLFRKREREGGGVSTQNISRSLIET